MNVYLGAEMKEDAVTGTFISVAASPDNLTIGRLELVRAAEIRRQIETAGSTRAWSPLNVATVVEVVTDHARRTSIAPTPDLAPLALAQVRWRVQEWHQSDHGLRRACAPPARIDEANMIAAYPTTRQDFRDYIITITFIACVNMMDVV